MQVKQLAALAALVLCGASWAQTVPAEAWVGPVISTNGAALLRHAVVAERQRALSVGQAIPEAWVGAASEAAIAVGAARRSEVVADLKLFERAGLLAAQNSEVYDAFSAPVRERMRVYQGQRQGPAFSREVARIEGVAGQAIGQAPASAAASTD